MIGLEGRIYIGVDGGGTKTTAIAITEKGTILGKTIGEQINFNTSTIDEAKQNLKNTIDNLAREYDISSYDCISIGMPSIDDEPTEEIFNSFVSGILPPNIVEMRSDAYMALMGVTLGNPGVMVISGTGSMAIAIDKNEKVHLIGGWGYLLKDKGSAYYIAIEGINAAVKSYENLGVKTELEDAVISFFGVESHRQLIEIFYNPPIPHSEIAKFAKKVIELSQSGDIVASTIVNKTITILAEYAYNLIEKVSEDCTVGMYGGVFQKNIHIAKRFAQLVNMKYPKTKVTFPLLPPEIGAVLYAIKKRRSVSVDRFLDNILEKT
jgi:glucosamine kinase